MPLAERALAANADVALRREHDESRPQRERPGEQFVILADPHVFAVAERVFIKKPTTHERLHESPFPARPRGSGDVPIDELGERDAARRLEPEDDIARSVHRVLPHPPGIVGDDVGVVRVPQQAGEPTGQEEVVGVEDRHPRRPRHRHA